MVSKRQARQKLFKCTIKTETELQNALRALAALDGIYLWRNNSGVAYDSTGRPVRYGLANDSAKINKIIKSSDLIGITPTQCPCGAMYGVFTALETKRPNWVFKGTEEELAQQAYLELVHRNFGIARFINSLKDF